MTDTLAMLRHELEARDGSFLLQLRCDLEWDRAAFTRLTNAMAACCREQAGSETCERWLAEGFWYTSWFVREWSTHSHFPRPYPEAYYEAAFTRLSDLAFWFFVGTSPFVGDKGFETL